MSIKKPAPESQIRLKTSLGPAVVLPSGVQGTIPVVSTPAATAAAALVAGGAKSAPASPPSSRSATPGADWARCYYDAWNRRDWEWISAMLMPEVEWTITARDEKIKGANAVIASFRGAIEGFPSAMIEVKSVHETGTVIVVECGIRSTGHAASRTASMCEIFEVKNGRCLRGTSYADSVRLLLDMSQATAAA